MHPNTGVARCTATSVYQKSRKPSPTFTREGAGEVQRTLSAVTGSDCAPHFREMYEREFDSIDDRQNRDRTMAAVLAYNMRDGDTDWTDTSSPGVRKLLTQSRVRYMY